MGGRKRRFESRSRKVQHLCAKRQIFRGKLGGSSLGSCVHVKNSTKVRTCLGRRPEARGRGREFLTRLRSRFRSGVDRHEKRKSFGSVRRASVAHDEFVRSEQAGRCCYRHRSVIGTSDSVPRQPSGLSWARATREVFRLQRRRNNNCRDSR